MEFLRDFCVVVDVIVLRLEGLLWRLDLAFRSEQDCLWLLFNDGFSFQVAKVIMVPR